MLCVNCGADPLVCAGPPGPALRPTKSASCNSEGPTGVGRGPGGPPHNLCKCLALDNVSGIVLYLGHRSSEACRTPLRGSTAAGKLKHILPNYSFIIGC